MPAWTDKEEELINQHYTRKHISEVEKLLPGRTRQQIYAKAYRMGYRKEETDTAEVYQLNISERNFRDAPPHLNVNGRYFWYSYLEQLNDIEFTDYSKLSDLCVWEQKKMQTLEKMKDNEDVIEYRDETGRVKHTQPSSYFTNLKTIQGEINKLREMIFKEADSKKKTQPDAVPALTKKGW